MPIVGRRFSCRTRVPYDICEQCFRQLCAQEKPENPKYDEFNVMSLGVTTEVEQKPGNEAEKVRHYVCVDSMWFVCEWVFCVCMCCVYVLCVCMRVCTSVRIGVSGLTYDEWLGVITTEVEQMPGGEVKTGVAPYFLCAYYFPCALM